METALVLSVLLTMAQPVTTLLGLHWRRVSVAVGHFETQTVTQSD